MLDVFRRCSFLLFIFCLLSAGAQPNTAASIKKSVQFLENKKIKSQNLLMIVEYLERSYGLKDNLEAQKLLKLPPVYDDEQANMKYFGRLYGVKNAITKKQVDQLPGILGLMVRSINADKFPIDKKFSDDLWAYSQNTDRDLTHAALCFAWIREQNLQSKITMADSLYRLQENNLLIMAEREGYISDSGLEALVALVRLGKSSAIKPGWIEKIIKGQNADGGWPSFAMETNSSEHTTILALWLLLDYEMGGKTSTKWIEAK